MQNLGSLKINYHKKRFKPVSNSKHGEVEESTIFHYSQDGDVLWAVYQGEKIKLGTITGVVREDGSLEYSYQHVNDAGLIRSGKCISTPEILQDGKLVLHEHWQWNDSGEEGESLMEEINY